MPSAFEKSISAVVVGTEKGGEGEGGGERIEKQTADFLPPFLLR
jgi:hypothetical protein